MYAVYCIFLILFVASYLLYVGSSRGVGGVCNRERILEYVCCGVLSDGSLVWMFV